MTLRAAQVILLGLIGSRTLLGQSYTLRQAVAEALGRYPATQVSLEQMAAATAAINLARTAYLPRLDLVAQANRATHNNVFGMLLPPATLPGISGPVLGTTGLDSVWGTAVGIQVLWEPFDLGLRSASVALAQASRNRAETALALTRLEVANAAATAFLTLVAAEQTAAAAEAGVRRAQVLRAAVEAQVHAQLRPGADLSRARAELAAAEVRGIQAQQAIAVAKASLGQLVGGDPAGLAVQKGMLLDPPPQAETPGAPPSSHPVLAQRAAVVAEAQASRRVLDRSYVPRFTLTGTTYARGTGALTDGRTLGGLSGLGPNVHNWGIGLGVTFPLFDLPALRARKEIAGHQERVEAGRYEQARQDLSAELARARAEMEAARGIARQTPVQLAAARDAERQAAARYKSGLGTLLEVADAQRLATQADIDDALARLNIWRAMLRAAAAAGDLEPFLTQASR